MGRRKTSTSVGTGVVKKPKSQVRKNRDIGKNFESKMFQYFTEYLRARNVKGIAYRYPDGKRFDQVIDILIDSNEFGYIGCECKSIKNSLERGGKLYFSELATISKRNSRHQFINQHDFLYLGGRFGLMAFNFRDMKKTIIVPHQLVYNKLVDGELYITTEYIITNGFDISDEKASLKLYIKNNCRTL